MDFPRYLVIEGPIGVGKTTLVRQLSAKRNARTILEIFEENPFLPRFYQDRERYAFQTEMFFLLSRFRQQKEIQQEELFRDYTISDYLFVKTRLFASLTLSADELMLYNRLFTILEPQVPRPDLVIYLHAPVRTLMRRIRQRGREMERNIEPDYLEALSEVYTEYFRDFSACPLLIVDSEAFNFADDERAVERLLETIAGMSGQRAWLERRIFDPEVA